MPSEEEFSVEKRTAPWVRVAIMIAAIGIIGLLSWHFTGAFLPVKAEEALIFQSALLLIVLGSALIEHKFTKPADSVVNSLMGMITLLTVHNSTSGILWWSIFGYCGFVFTVAAVCVIISSGRDLTGTRRWIANITYRIAALLGKARILYSVVFLFGVVTFYGLQSSQTALLIAFWGGFIVIWPLGLPQYLSSFRISRKAPNAIGEVIRTDWPNIIHVSLSPLATWDHKFPKVYQQIDCKQTLVLPLCCQVQGEQRVGTGLQVRDIDQCVVGLEDGCLYDLPEEQLVPEGEILECLGGKGSGQLLGFIVEGSKISEIRFEILDTDSCQEGKIVVCQVGSERIYYQVVDGATHEESFERNRHGCHIATASQLGTLDKTKGFRKYLWLPPMNSPVFSCPPDLGVTAETLGEHDFVYGVLPGTGFKIGGPLAESVDHHMAILGITGSGKTELAFDIIRHVIEKNMKVVCIDLTGAYHGRLESLNPQHLSLPAESLDQLSKKLFEAETGEYGAGREKKALKELADQLRSDVKNSIDVFLNSKEEDSRLGIITLEEISNTKATLFVTELYLTCLLHYARDNIGNCPRILIVVEEAHTVMPEPGTMGLADYDSRGLVSKIAQIALQGRKYGVGLLVIAQRTATVSKSVLTQCNTVISFTCIDDTSLNFLSNVYGNAHVSLIPALPPLQAVVFGKGVRSQRPLVVEIPFDDRKSKS